MSKQIVVLASGNAGKLRELGRILTPLQMELHSQSECEAQTVKRLQELRNAFARLPDVLARSLYQAKSPDAIKVRVEEELRRIFEVLSRE